MLTGAVSVFWQSTKLYFITAESRRDLENTPLTQASGVTFHQAKMLPLTAFYNHNLH